jgi:hypothetical protein
MERDDRAERPRIGECPVAEPMAGTADLVLVSGYPFRRPTGRRDEFVLSVAPYGKAIPAILRWRHHPGSEQVGCFHCGKSIVSRQAHAAAPQFFIGACRQRRGLFHELFDLPKNKKIALYSGSFSASNMVDDIALSVASWPDDWVLVTHSRHSYGDGSLLIPKKLLQKVCSPGRVFFSSAPATPEELPDILDWADVSLAFYGPDEALVLSRRNNQLMGYSSGKVNSYVQAGLPVIVNDFTRMSNWVASSGCGLVVQQPCQIGSALRGMDGHLEEYSANAIAFFNQHLCIDEQVKRVADRVLGAD